MTIEEAFAYFADDDIYSLDQNRPFGVDINDIYESCVHHGYGPIMDRLADHALITRNVWTDSAGCEHTETDAELRTRLLRFVRTHSFDVDVDRLVIRNSSRGHQHEWRLYQGFIETYEYCTSCDEKKR